MATMRRSALTLVLLIAAVGWTVAPASAANTAYEVDANGNAVTGGMSFFPRIMELKVGDGIIWVNTDFLAPHTSTADNNLWDVSGNYAGPPITPVPGYAPGASAGRRFEAGTHRYYCVIHGRPAMDGIVKVPVTLNTEGRRIQVHWATGEQPGIVFDVQRRRSTAAGWTNMAKRTAEPSGSFRARGKGVNWRVRARMRSSEDPAAKTDWSPVAEI